MIKVREIDYATEWYPLYKVQELTNAVWNNTFANTEDDILQFSEVFAKVDEMPPNKELGIAITVDGTNSDIDGYEFQGELFKKGEDNKYYISIHGHEGDEDDYVEELIDIYLSYDPDKKVWDYE